MSVVLLVLCRYVIACVAPLRPLPPPVPPTHPTTHHHPPTTSSPVPQPKVQLLAGFFGVLRICIGHPPSRPPPPPAPLPSALRPLPPRWSGSDGIFRDSLSFPFCPPFPPISSHVPLAVEKRESPVPPRPKCRRQATLYKTPQTILS